MRRGLVAPLTAAALLAAGCASGSGGGDQSFDDAVRNGASCSKLYEIRNALDPKDPDIPRMNERLRQIGCHTSTSTRTDR